MANDPFQQLVDAGVVIGNWGDLNDPDDIQLLGQLTGRWNGNAPTAYIRPGGPNAERSIAVWILDKLPDVEPFANRPEDAVPGTPFVLTETPRTLHITGNLSGYRNQG